MNEKHNPESAMADREHHYRELEEHVTAALDRARAGGADGAEVTASVQGGLNTTVRLGEVETIEHNRDRGLSVTVLLGDRKGHASSGDLSDASLARCVERALDIARYTEGDACNGLPDPERLATATRDLDLWHPQALEAEAAIAYCQAIEAAGRADARITNSEGGSLSSSWGLSVLGNSAGFLGRSEGTRYGQSCVLIAGEGEGMQRDYWFDSRRAMADLEAPEATGRRAAERTVERLNARKINTCEAPILFTPELARTLLGHLVGGISGGALYRNASFLKGALGERLFPEWLNVWERPELLRAAGSTSFDAEGVAVQDRPIVEAGVLQGYVLSTYSARRLGMETTGNAGGVHNLCLEGDTVPASELLERLGTGLLVTEVMGQGVRMVNGDYSRGAAGFWVENGTLQYPVEEVTIAGNLRDMFHAVVAVGDDVDDRGNIHCGSMLLGPMTIAGS